MKIRSLFCCLVLLAAIQINAQIHNIENFKGRITMPLKHGSDHPGKRMDPDMNRWRAHGLGQFIHWGVYAMAGGGWNDKVYSGAAEWIRAWSPKGGAPENWREIYDNLYKEFNPKNFDAKKWAKQAKGMGARYMIFTTKHHDGFCMWPSKFSKYTIANTPYKKDIVKEVVDAYTAEGIDVILYFSVMDWAQGGWVYSEANIKQNPEKWNGFKEFTRNQIFELLQSYPQVKGLWFDGTWDDSWVSEAEFSHNLEKEIKAKYPGLIIGSRFRADEYGNRQYDANGDLIGDYDQTWERDIPISKDQLNGNDWDCAMTIPENGWGYSKQWTTYVKTSEELIQMISECASMGGNFVLNFGPDGDGNIRPEETKIASDIGSWMKKNGEAIYASEPVDFKKQGWGFMTKKNNKLYMHVYNRPINNVLRLEFPRKSFVPGKIKVLSDGKSLEIKDAGRNKKNNRLFNIYLPADYVTKDSFVIEVELISNTGDIDAYQQAKV